MPIPGKASVRRPPPAAGVLDLPGRLAERARGPHVRPLFQTITDLKAGAEELRAGRFGVIEARDGRFYRVRLRPYPKIGSVPEILLLGETYHRIVRGDRCLLYYNQPGRHRNFLAVKHLVSARGTRRATIRRVLEVLDEIARLKQVDALLCDVANWRLSTAIMLRWGWEPHCPSRWHRHFIRRFYGAYPPPADWIPCEREAVGV